jgi:ABC-type transport system involved in multi-copper enzyme maturation permease subunit
MKLAMVMIGLALQSILKNKTRAMLTMLGIVIGVAAVVVMVAVGYGARSRIHEQINTPGTNMAVITPGASTSGGVSQGAQAFGRRTPARSSSWATSAWRARWRCSAARWRSGSLPTGTPSASKFRSRHCASR